MTPPALSPEDVLTVEDIMVLLKISRSAAYALAADLGRNIPGVGVRVLRGKVAELLTPPAEEPSAPSAPTTAPASTPRRRGRGTRRACTSGEIVAHGRTAAELRAATGTGKRKR